MPMVACDSGSNVSCILPGCLPDPESVLEFHFRTPVPTGTETETLSDSVKKNKGPMLLTLSFSALGSRFSLHLHAFKLLVHKPSPKPRDPKNHALDLQTNGNSIPRLAPRFYNNTSFTI